MLQRGGKGSARELSWSEVVGREVSSCPNNRHAHLGTLQDPMVSHLSNVCLHLKKKILTLSVVGQLHVLLEDLWVSWEKSISGVLPRDLEIISRRQVPCGWHQA